MPLVSICIPTYNGAAYLRDCLDSALAQTSPDFEVLIVDDQSTDESYKIAQGYAARDRRVRVACNRENLGLVGNWNQCVLLARGDWIKFLFQDDMLEPHCLERMLAVCGPDTSMVVCQRNFIFEEDSEILKKTFIPYIQNYNMDKIFQGSTAISAEALCKGVLGNLIANFVGEPTAILLHRSVFSRFGLFNSCLIQMCDFEYWIRVGSHTGLVYIPEMLVHFRRHKKGTSAINENSKKFRLIPDYLVCFHDFVFHPLYAPLRFYASECQPPINLNQCLAAEVKRAWKVARQFDRNRANRDPSLLDEMNQMTRLFPGIQMIRKIPGSRTLSRYWFRIRNFF